MSDQQSAEPTKRAKRAPVALPATIHPEQRLDRAQVCALWGCGPSKLYVDVAAGRMPEPERDGRRWARWRAGDVLEAVAKRRARLLAAQTD